MSGDGVDTAGVVPPDVLFTCSLCKGAVVSRKYKYGVAECFVWERRVELVHLRGAPVHPEQCRPEDVPKWFALSPRCRKHVADHQRPPILYEDGVVMAWKLLPEETRRLIIVKGILDS